MAASHDLGYKELFSHPELIRELLESFVDLPFVKELDYSSLERVDKSFVTRSAQKIESDLIYKVGSSGEFVGKPPV